MKPAPGAAAALCVYGPEFSATLHHKDNRNNGRRVRTLKDRKIESGSEEDVQPGCSQGGRDEVAASELKVAQLNKKLSCLNTKH